MEHLDDGTTEIGMHDLWREFATMETIRGEIKSRRWVFEDGVNERGVNEGRNANEVMSCGSKNLQRICFVFPAYYSVTWNYLLLSYCSKVTVLRLVNVFVKMHGIDLSALKQLKSLEIIFEPPQISPTVSGIGFLRNLVALRWCNINMESLSAAKEINCLTDLQILQLQCCHVEASTMLHLGQLRWLRQARFKFAGKVTILGLSSRMTNLRILEFVDCSMLQGCPGVDDVVSLEVLLLSGCRGLEQLPDIRKLTKLRILDISGCGNLKAVKGLGSLVALKELYAGGCENLDEMPNVSGLTNLEVLDLQGCKSLKYIPGMGNLIALQEFIGSSELLEDLPDRGILTQFHTADICEQDLVQQDDESSQESQRILNFRVLEFVSTLALRRVYQKLTNLSKLSTLRSLTLCQCRALESLPDMGKDMRLESLTIEKCKSLRSWDGVGEFGCSAWILPHLEILKWIKSGVVELPDLSHFPRLWKLELDHYSRTLASDCRGFAVHCLANHLQLENLKCRKSPITELPDLSKFPCLKILILDGCNNLTRLTISAPLTTLEVLCLERCRSLDELPDVHLLPGLIRCFNMVVALEGPNDLSAGPSSMEMEPCTSDFIPYNESISELGLVPVSKSTREHARNYTEKPQIKYH